MPDVDVLDLERRLSALSDERPRGKGASRLAELYFDKSSSDRPLVIVHHIRKTAGTSLREVMKANYADAQCVLVPGVGYKKGVEVNRARMLGAYEKLWEELAPHERSSLRCIASHEANFLYPFVDRPRVIVSLIRQPLERIMSRYYFANRPGSGSKERKARTAGERVRAGLSTVLREISLEDVYSDVAEHPLPKLKEESALGSLSLFNGQARSLLDPFFDTSELEPTRGPSGDADVWRERLFTIVDDHYELGVSERFDDFVRFMSDTFGWSKVFTPRAKVNTERPTTDSLSPKLRDAITDYNWLDMELYSRQRSR